MGHQGGIPLSRQAPARRVDHRAFATLVALGAVSVSILQLALMPAVLVILLVAAVGSAVLRWLGPQRGLGEIALVSIQLGYAMWYVPVRLSAELTESTLAECALFLASAAWLFVRPSPVPAIFLALYHRYCSYVLVDEYFQLTGGLGLREVPMARVWLVHILFRWEILALLVFACLTSVAFRERATGWPRVLAQGMVGLVALLARAFEFVRTQVRVIYERS